MIRAIHQARSIVIRVKAAVRKRDGFTCVYCGKSNDQQIAEHGRQLDVHRIKPGSLYSVGGCETVCRACHGKLPSRQPGEPDLANEPRMNVRFGAEHWLAIAKIKRHALKRNGIELTTNEIINLGIAELAKKYGRRHQHTTVP